MAVHSDVVHTTQKPRINGIRKHVQRKDAKPLPKTKSSNHAQQSASLATENVNNGDMTPEVEDQAHIPIVHVGPHLRALHGEDEKSKIHRSMLLASDDMDLRYTLESDSILDTFGLCKCLRGNVFPFAESRVYLRAWMDDAASVAGQFIADATRRTDPINASSLCPFCKRRNKNEVNGGDTPSGQRHKAKKPLVRSVGSGHDGFRYQADISMYIKDYRKCRTAGNQNSVPVLGKDVPDPYLQRIRSFSDVIEKLELLTTNKYPSTDTTRRILKRTPSDPSLCVKPSNCGRQSPDRQVSRLDTINLTPVAGRTKTLPSTMKELVYQTKRRSKDTTDSKETTVGFRSENKEQRRPRNKLFTQLTNDRISCNHVTSSVATKKPHPNTGLAKCKKFTSSTQYLDLTSPRMSFPLPVQVSLAVGDGIAERLKPGRSVYLPRCRSAASCLLSPAANPNSTASTSSGFWSSDGSAVSSTSRSLSKPIQTRLFRSNTVNDVSGYEHRHKGKSMLYRKAPAYLGFAAGKVKSLDLTTGELLAACLLKPAEQQ